MEAATRNAESPQSLPLFRAEALAARQKIQGEALFIRPFSFVFFLALIVCLAIVSLGFLLLANFQPRVTVSGALAPASGHSQSGLEASFNVPQELALNVRPGLIVPIRCQSCGPSGSQSGTVTRVEPLRDAPLNTSSSDAGASGNPYRITVAVTPFNPLPDADHWQGAKLEAEFPLQSRPLIHWLIGSAAW